MVGAIAFGARLLRDLHDRPDARLRHRRSRREGVRQLGRAARRSRAKSYVGSAMADLLDLVAIVSAVGAGLGCTLGRRADALRASAATACCGASCPASRESTGVPADGARARARVVADRRSSASRSRARSRSTSFFYLATIGHPQPARHVRLTNLGALRYLFLRRRAAGADVGDRVSDRRDRVRRLHALQERLAGARLPVQRLPVHRRRLAPRRCRRQLPRAGVRRSVSTSSAPRAAPASPKSRRRSRREPPCNVSRRSPIDPPWREPEEITLRGSSSRS